MFIELEVKTSIIVHGYDENNKEIAEKVNEVDFMKKIVAVHRILSISENYILVSSSHGRVMYWEYKGNIAAINQKLQDMDIVIG